jgi:hypothetical protein
MRIVITGIIVSGRNCVESILHFVSSWEKELYVTLKREFSVLHVRKCV